MESITDPLSRTVRFEYDSAGRVTRQTLPDLRSISFTYDENGNLTSLTPPSRPAHGFGFTVRDLTARYAPPGVAATRFRPDGASIDLAYDAAARIMSMMTPRGA